MSSDFENSAGSDSSESDPDSDTVDEAGIYNPYQFEPRAEDEIADAADNMEQHEDGLAAHTLDQRQEGLVAINSCLGGKEADTRATLAECVPNFLLTTTLMK
ncbi:hypothetical protein AC249_AIPGENE21809 [Exaiptasia diaphana]|nr:hypothetical protein AC249_AIPGENE21809 [Exaiptasia diaphana]